ncbi:DinB family protein [Shouchella shacheensis]|uniref:DinB family protein n=1 Tax=Shouchella shacheensis TaxID=1649580 RepID=UPI00073FE5C6|nr:DinB family protein [Shouchella shacheensis]
MSLHAFQFARKANEEVITRTTQENVDVIPEGFSNSIHWNYGHILVIADHLLSHAKNYDPVVPASYQQYFHKGTSPTDWSGDVPTLEQLKEVSSSQKKAIQSLLERNKESDATEVFTLFDQRFETVGELLSFVAFHEGMHYRTVQLYHNRLQ